MPLYYKGVSLKVPVSSLQDMLEDLQSPPVLCINGPGEEKLYRSQSVDIELSSEKERIKKMLSEGSICELSWEAELFTLQDNNSKLVAALHKANANVEQWKKQLSAYQEETERLREQVAELEAQAARHAACDIGKDELNQSLEELEAVLKAKDEDHLFTNCPFRCPYQYGEEELAQERKVRRQRRGKGKRKAERPLLPSPPAEKECLLVLPPEPEGEPHQSPAREGEPDQSPETRKDQDWMLAVLSSLCKAAEGSSGKNRPAAVAEKRANTRTPACPDSLPRFAQGCLPRFAQGCLPICEWRMGLETEEIHHLQSKKCDYNEVEKEREETVQRLQEVESRNTELERRVHMLEQTLSNSLDERSRAESEVQRIIDILDVKIFDLTDLRQSLATLVHK
ncbi:HOME3 protein, partial [Polyodon spathula]|nr:HOME3 protein [Polyodon spathula]